MTLQHRPIPPPVFGLYPSKCFLPRGISLLREAKETHRENLLSIADIKMRIIIKQNVKEEEYCSGGNMGWWRVEWDPFGMFFIPQLNHLHLQIATHSVGRYGGLLIYSLRFC